LETAQVKQIKKKSKILYIDIRVKNLINLRTWYFTCFSQVGGLVYTTIRMR
jgi:hypothetical protein